MSEPARPEPWRRWIFMGIAVLIVIPLLALAGVAFSGLFFSNASTSTSQAKDTSESAETVAIPPAGPDQLQVVILKSKRQVIVYRGDKQIRSFPAVLGPKADGDKVREGDGRTPIGTYYVCQKNAKSKYYLFIGISYPNEEDADRGLANGLITSDEHDAIIQAIAKRKTPPWYTRLGGEIGIHGGGTAWDWTEGCVALDNGDMRDLYALIRVGTTVTIKP